MSPPFPSFFGLIHLFMCLPPPSPRLCVMNTLSDEKNPFDDSAV